MRQKISILLAVVLAGIGVFSTNTYAKEPEAKTVVSEIRPELEESNVARNSAFLMNDGGILQYGAKDYTINVPKSTTYTLTLSVKNLEGSDGVWMILQKANSSATVDTVVRTGSFQKRYYLTAGTWYLRLASPSGVHSFGVSIHETF